MSLPPLSPTTSRPASSCIRSQHSALFASSCRFDCAFSSVSGRLFVSPFASVKRHGNYRTFPAHVHSMLGFVRHILPPLFIFMISASGSFGFTHSLFDPFFGRFLSKQCPLRSALRYHSCAQAPSNTIRSFPPCLDERFRSAAFASSVVASTPSVLPSIIPLDARTSSTHPNTNFQRRFLEPEALAPMLREIVLELDADIPVERVTSLDAVFASERGAA